MRPLLIDFLAEPPSTTPRTRWARRLMWSVVLLALLANVAMYSQWQDRHGQLVQQLDALTAKRNQTAGGAGPAVAAPPSFDPMTLANIEQSVRDIRRAAPAAQLRLDSLLFDDRLGKVTLHGESLHEQPINQLRDQLLARFPLATTGFPSVQGRTADGRPVQFEIGVQLTPLPGNAR